MAGQIDQNEESRMRSMFGREIPPVPDDGFSTSIVKRIRLKIWQRRLILLAAIIPGLLIAVPMLSQLLLTMSNELVILVARGEQSESLGQVRVLLTMLPVRQVAQAAGNELMNISTQIGTVGWFRQNQALALAGLLAVGSLIATRLLER